VTDHFAVEVNVGLGRGGDVGEINVCHRRASVGGCEKMSSLAKLMGEKSTEFVRRARGRTLQL
jgi:hypothetical protein